MTHFWSLFVYKRPMWFGYMFVLCNVFEVKLIVINFFIQLSTILITEFSKSVSNVNIVIHRTQNVVPRRFHFHCIEGVFLVQQSNKFKIAS